MRHEDNYTQAMERKREGAPMAYLYVLFRNPYGVTEERHKNLSQGSGKLLIFKLGTS
jgi:hypothetical protein